jgi:hypothetical protein
MLAKWLAREYKCGERGASMLLRKKYERHFKKREEKDSTYQRRRNTKSMLKKAANGFKKQPMEWKWLGTDRSPLFPNHSIPSRIHPSCSGLPVLYQAPCPTRNILIRTSTIPPARIGLHSLTIILLLPS